MESLENDEMNREFANDLALRRFAWIFGAILLVALGFPHVLFAATISSFLSFAAGILATIALFSREPVLAGHLTRWDVAAALYAASMFAGFFVDIEAVRLFIMEQQALAN
ncbi:MAG: hypothetical protein KDH19_08670 [Geminicoccaceae bacterium]|nr:hypothetical protein [Geminicoccaceae bacterium]